MLFPRYGVRARVDGQEVGRWGYWGQRNANNMVVLLMEWAKKLTGEDNWQYASNRDSSGRFYGSWLFPGTQKSVLITVQQEGYRDEN